MCNCYIPPNSGESYLNSLLIYFSDLLSRYDNVIFTGDFNLPDINWSSLSAHSSSSNAFCDFIFDNNFTQFVDRPTHSGGNVLDLVLSTDLEIIDNLLVFQPRNSLHSDHFMISFELLLPSTPSHSRQLPHGNDTLVFDFPKANMPGLCSFLENSDFSHCFLSCDVDHVWSSIKLIIQQAMDLFIPTVKLRSHQFPKWFTPDIRHRLNCLRTLRRKCVTHPTAHNLSKLLLLESNLDADISSAKSRYETDLIFKFANSNCNKIFKYIRGISGHSYIPPSVELCSAFATSDLDKASLFNKYFYSIFTLSSFELPPLDSLPTLSLTLSDISISTSEVFESLVSLDPTKAMGIDCLGPRILKECAHILFQPLHHLFCLSLSSHSIPEEWRIHQITPIHKSGDRSLVSNYRPISLLCSISKVLERIIYNHVLGFISCSISPSQFGFLRNRSTAQQLLTFLNCVHESLLAKTQSDVIYLDFRKAFDSVSHNELLFKLWCLGIRGNLWCWFKAYLSDRMQCVAINGHTSGLLPVLSGVPQGSILGPLLFLLFINDLPQSVRSSSMLLFADDAKCFRPITNPSDCSLLQDDLVRLLDWSNKWKLHFNISKCALVRFSYGTPISPASSYCMGDQDIVALDCLRDLGVLISDDLSWSAHYDLLCSRAYKILGLLRSLQQCIRHCCKKTPLHFPCSFPANVLLSCLASPPYQGYHYSGKDPASRL